MASGDEPPGPRIRDAPRTREGFFEARPGDVVGRDDLTVVDVRPDGDLTGELGHIHQAVHLPAPVLEHDGLSGLALSRPVVVVCSNGRRSRECARILVTRHRYQEVYHLVGGMVRWVAEDRPIARVPTWRTLSRSR